MEARSNKPCHPIFSDSLWRDATGKQDIWTPRSKRALCCIVDVVGLSGHRWDAMCESKMARNKYSHRPLHRMHYPMPCSEHVSRLYEISDYRVSSAFNASPRPPLTVCTARIWLCQFDKFEHGARHVVYHEARKTLRKQNSQQESDARSDGAPISCD